MTDPDSYSLVDLPDPDEKPYEEWDAAERRAWMLREINKAGHPRPFKQVDVADRFDVSPPMITKDRKAIAEDVVASLGDREMADIATIIRSSVMDVYEEDERDPMDAISAAKEWYDWLADAGAVEREPDKHEVSQDVDADVNHSGSFNVTWDAVEDDMGDDD